jgi:hypothetical protein
MIKHISNRKIKIHVQHIPDKSKLLRMSMASFDASYGSV